MSNYNGVGIYNFGGGDGGGMPDVGPLADSDFIKVENNTLSSYHDESRNDINFYFDVDSGEALNAVIDVTTDVNATVHIYKVENGLFVPVPYNDSNTITAGNEYKIYVVGDSFYMNDVITPADPVYAVINSEIYEVQKINDLYWITEDFKDESLEDSEKKNGVVYYKQRYMGIAGWRLPKRTEITSLVHDYPVVQLKSTTGWAAGYAGNNNSGLDIKGHGRLNKTYHNIDGEDYYYYSMCIDDTSQGEVIWYYYDYNNNYSFGGPDDNFYYPIRLVRDV